MEKEKGKRLLKRSPLFFIVLAIIGFSSGTVAAALFNSLSPIKLSVFQQQVTESDFTVLSTIYRIRSGTKILYIIEIKNLGADIHSANVTLTFVDDAGDSIGSDSFLTGNINAGATLRHTATVIVTDVNLWKNTLIDIQQII